MKSQLFKAALIFLFIILFIGYQLVDCYKDGVKAKAEEQSNQRSKTIVTKDGRTYTGLTYEIGRSGTLYIEGDLVERDGWSIR